MRRPPGPLVAVIVAALPCAAVGLASCANVIGLDKATRVDCVDDCGADAASSVDAAQDPSASSDAVRSDVAQIEDADTGAPTRCTADTDCSSPDPRCDTSTGVCVPCLPQNDNCGAGTYCTAMANTYSCAPGCASAAECLGDGGTTLDCCNNICVDTATDNSNCGTCGANCAADAGACCSAACENLGDNPAHCGGCGNVCSSNHMATVACGGGVCDGTCAAGYADCNANKLTDGCEVDTQTDSSNCGVCGKVCGAGLSCAGGLCRCATLSNVALTATPTDSGGGAAPYGPADMNDGVLETTNCNVFTWITATDAPGTAWVQYSWTTAQTLVSMQMDTTSSTTADSCGYGGTGANGGRTVAAAEIQWWNGSAWVTDGSVSGETGNWDYTFTAPVTTTEVRLYVVYTNAVGQASNPIIFEWQVSGCN
jgi:hypothetical protein